MKAGQESVQRKGEEDCGESQEAEMKMLRFRSDQEEKGPSPRSAAPQVF